MLASMRSRNISCDNEAKFIQDRITAVERTTSELCHVFGDYSRKAARIRDKGDEIAKAALIFSDSETINKTTSDEVANFANCMSTLSDYGDARVQSINDKIVQEFTQYENVCKRAKDEVRTIYSARDKELARKKQLDRLRDRNPRNRQLIV